MTSHTKRFARLLDHCAKEHMADYELRHRNVIEARRHLASMSPERRAMLEAEWDDAPKSGAPVTVPGSNAATLWKNGAR